MLGDGRRSPFRSSALSAMRFSVAQLLVLTTATAAFFALLHTHPIVALGIPTMTVSSMCAWKTANRYGADLLNTIGVASLSAFLTILFYGFATLAASYAYMYVTNTWPDPKTVYVSTEFAVAMFVVCYGGGAALLGTIVGFGFFAIHYFGYRNMSPAPKTSTAE